MVARSFVPFQTGSDVHSASSSTVDTSYFPGVRRPKRGADHQPPCLRRVANGLDLYLRPSLPCEPIRACHGDDFYLQNSVRVLLLIEDFKTVTRFVMLVPQGFCSECCIIRKRGANGASYAGIACRGAGELWEKRAGLPGFNQKWERLLRTSV